MRLTIRSAALGSGEAVGLPLRMPGAFRPGSRRDHRPPCPSALSMIRRNAGARHQRLHRAVCKTQRSRRNLKDAIEGPIVPRRQIRLGILTQILTPMENGRPESSLSSGAARGIPHPAYANPITTGFSPALAARLWTLPFGPCGRQQPSAAGRRSHR